MNEPGPAPIPPPPPDDASPEVKDQYWFDHYYQGDKQPQLTLRSVIMGGIVGMFMALSNLYTTLKVGWSFAVAITACVISYVVWNAIRTLSGRRLSQMSLLENNCMQSTASAAGYSTGALWGRPLGRSCSSKASTGDGMLSLHSFSLPQPSASFSPFR